MPLINQLPAYSAAPERMNPVLVDRHTLMKRRWRATAEDGTDMAIDLPQPCRNGDVLLVKGNAAYQVVQSPERVIRIELPDDRQRCAWLGWFLGNQHLPVDVRDGFIFLAQEEQVVKRLERTGIAFEVLEAVFTPDPHSSLHHHH